MGVLSGRKSSTGAALQLVLSGTASRHEVRPEVLGAHDFTGTVKAEGVGDTRHAAGGAASQEERGGLEGALWFHIDATQSSVFVAHCLSRIQLSSY